MGTGNVQLKPDIVVKNYWRNNEQFADFFNAVLFQGKNVIKPDELEELDTEESSILEHKDYAETIVAGVVNNKIDYGQLAQKGDADMCSVFEEAWQDGKTEGKAEEIVEMGREFGLSDGEILIRLQSKLNVSVQKAQDYLVMFTKQTV